jgi:hypothetical protein
MPHDLLPSGIPLSRALIIRPGVANDDLREAVDAINRVHGDGDLPEIPVSFAGGMLDADGEADGRFTLRRHHDGPAVPVSIVIRSGAPHRQFVLVHEVGHLIDLSGLPGHDYSSFSLDVPELDDWRDKVVGTNAYRSLRALTDPVVGGDPSRALKLSTLEELWARSYAQFVAVRSLSAELLRALDRLRDRPRTGVYYPRQWDDDDFGDVDRAIEHLFRRQQWMTS